MNYTSQILSLLSLSHTHSLSLSCKIDTHKLDTIINLQKTYSLVSHLERFGVVREHLQDLLEAVDRLDNKTMEYVYEQRQKEKNREKGQ